MMKQSPPAALYAEKLLYWYDRNLRLLPWRITPQQQAQGIKADPYRVWLSEVMLQQTTVEAVKPYFAKFMAAWPTLAALSAASLDDLLKAWAGLGYYSRARNLKACADKIMADYGGRFPRSAAELRKLPGIGAYTSAAIAAIAFDEPCAVVDANVERVIARLFCITAPLPAAREEIRAACQSITPQRRAGDFASSARVAQTVVGEAAVCRQKQRRAQIINRAGDFAQAMMDLGATLCSAKKPNCLLCPLAEECVGRQRGMAEELPRKTPKRAREERCGAAFVAFSATGKVYLQKRAERGLLGGMAQVPNYFSAAAANAPHGGQADLTHAPFTADWRCQGQITHIFTHFRLTLSVYKAENIAENAPLTETAEQGFWVAVEEARHEALPTVMKKALAKALPSVFKKKIMDISQPKI